MREERIAFYLNDHPVELIAPPAAPALDLLRRRLALFGTKEGCREGECGSCTVLFGRLRSGRIAYRAEPACLLPAAELSGGHLVTIEGLAPIAPTPLQRAFVEEGAIQCGFCTPGIIMALTGYLLSGRELSRAGALDALDGNICRCTGYASIRRAVASALARSSLEGRTPSVEELVASGFLPPYLLSIPQRLASLPASRRREPSKGGGKRGAPTLLAGGTDLYIRRGDSFEEAAVRLIGELGLAGPIVEGERAIAVPAATTIEELRLDPIVNRAYPGFGERLRLFGSTILRNRATVGGNIVNASPVGDLPVLLLAMGATLLLGPADGEAGSLRRLPLERFYLGYKRLELREGELVRGVELPEPPDGQRWGFSRVAKRERLDIPAASAALLALPRGEEIGAARISLGGVAPVPLYAAAASRALSGSPIEAPALRAALEAAEGEIAPIDDLRGSASYRRTLVGRLLAALLLDLFPERLDYAALAAELEALEAARPGAAESSEAGDAPARRRAAGPDAGGFGAGRREADLPRGDGPAGGAS